MALCPLPTNCSKQRLGEVLLKPSRYIAQMFNDICEPVNLQTAVAQVDCCAKLHDGEEDLTAMSEGDLWQLATSHNITKELQNMHQVQEKLTAWRKLASKGQHTAIKGVNALRAKGKLLQMQNKGSRFKQQMNSEFGQPTQQQQHETTQQQTTSAQVKPTAKVRSGQQATLQHAQPPAQLQPGASHPAGRTPAQHFRAGQQGGIQTFTPRGTNSRRQQQALTQHQPQQTAGQYPLIDKIISLSQQKTSGTASVAHYATSGGQLQQQGQQQAQQRQFGQPQQMQQQMRPNAFPRSSQMRSQPGTGGQPLPYELQRPAGSVRTTLSLHPTQASKQGVVQGRHRTDHITLKECASCRENVNITKMDEIPNSKILLCRRCFAAQTNPQVQVPKQAAPLDPSKVPQCKMNAPGRAAIGRQRQDKKGNSNDAPIDLATDTDDEEEQQKQQHESSSTPEAPEPQQAAATVLPPAGPAAAAGSRHTRRSSPVVDLLSESNLGTTMKFQGLEALYPASGGKGAVSVTADDLERLDPDAFLNDTIIDYYIKRLELSLPPEVVSRVHFFNSFFYKKLTEKSSTTPGASKRAEDVGKRNHDRVKSWTKGINIFSKDYLFVPIHDALHWSLVIVCHPGLLESTAAALGWSLQPAAAAAPAAAAPGDSEGSKPGDAAAAPSAGAPDTADEINAAPCIIHLDSMTSGHNTTSIGNALRQYLEHEWMRKVKEQRQKQGTQEQQPAAKPAEEQTPLLKFDTKALPHSRICDKLPKQDNHCDCGLFVLTYLEFFVHSAPKALNATVIKGLQSNTVELCPLQPKLLRKDWFEPALASCLRGHLRHQLLKLMIEQAADKDSSQVVKAVADVNQYEEGLELQRQRLQEQQEPGEVNPVFAYMSPTEYQKPETQQLLHSYKLRQEELKRSRRNKRQQQRQSGLTGAELKRLEYWQSNGDAGGDPGSDKDWEPEAKRSKGPKVKLKHGNHTIFSSDDEKEGQPLTQQQRGTTPVQQRVFGPQLPDASQAAAVGSSADAGKAVEHCTVSGSDDEDDAFQDRQPSKRARVASASAGKAQQKQPVMMQRESQAAQELWLQKQHQNGKDADGDAMQVDEPASVEQQVQQQKASTAGGKRQQEPLSDQPAAQRPRRTPLPDDAGGSESSSESNNSYNRSISDGSPGGSAGNQPVGFDIAAAVRGEPEETFRMSGGYGQQQQHARGRMPRVGEVEQQLPALLQDMSITPPANKKTSAAAAAAAATPASDAPDDQLADNDDVGVPASGHDTVDLCGNDDSEDGDEDGQHNHHQSQQQQQQQQQEEQEADQIVQHCKQADDAGGHRQQQQRQQHQQQKDEASLWRRACEILRELSGDDLEYLRSVLAHEFPNYTQHQQVEAMSHEDKDGLLSVIRKAELDVRLTQSLLPHFVEALHTRTSVDSVNEEGKQQWTRVLNGYQCPQPQQHSAGKGKTRASSAGQRRSRAAAAAAAVDHKQQKLTNMGVMVEYPPGQDVSPEQRERDSNSLQARMLEEQCIQEQEQQQQPNQAQQRSVSQDDVSEEQPRLELKLCDNDSDKEVCDLASDSDVEVLDDEQQHQKHPQQQQRLQQPPSQQIRLQARLMHPCRIDEGQGLMAACPNDSQHQQQHKQGVQQAEHTRRQLRALVRSEVYGTAPLGAAARSVAGDIGVQGGSTYSSYQTTYGGPGPAQHGQQQHSFIDAFQVENTILNMLPQPPEDPQQQQHPPQIPADVRPNYASGLTSNDGESVVTDEHQQQVAPAAGEVTSPPPLQPSAAAAAAAAAPTAKANTAAAAQKLRQNISWLRSVPLAQGSQSQPQHAATEKRRTRYARACGTSVNVQANSSSVECPD